MTVVPATEFYEYPIENDTAQCESCGKEIHIPEMNDPERNFKEPFWQKEEVHTYIGGNYDKFHAFCKECFEEQVIE